MFWSAGWDERLGSGRKGWHQRVLLLGCTYAAVREKNRWAKENG